MTSWSSRSRLLSLMAVKNMVVVMVIECIRRWSMSMLVLVLRHWMRVVFCGRYFATSPRPRRGTLGVKKKYYLS